MNLALQKEKAEILLALHSCGNLLVLPNVWNPVGARSWKRKATLPWRQLALRYQLSWDTRMERRSRGSTAIDIIERIARSVDVPVTADIETGYGDSLSELEETAEEVMETGVVGVNIEDGLEGGGALRAVEEQSQRIATLRKVAGHRGVHLVINARIDSYLSSSFTNKDEATEEAVKRARAYSEAGADCIYPMGPGDEERYVYSGTALNLPSTYW